MIRRDGTQTSLWQNRTAFVPRNTLQKRSFDVAIIGGGITGLSTAVRLQRAGLQCVILEAETLCFGTTGGTTAHLNTLLDTPYSTIESNFSKETASAVARAVARAIDDVKNNIQEFGIDCGFEMVDAFLYSQDESQTKELSSIYQSSLEAGISITYANEIPVPIPFEQAVQINEQAKLHPTDYCMGLAEAFENMGGVIVQQCRVVGIKEGERLVLETSRLDSFEAATAIFATHIPTGINLLHLRCSPWRSYAMAVKLRNESQYPQALAYDMYDPYHYYRTQVVDGQPYLIVGGEDHKTGHETNTSTSFQRLEAHVRRYFDVEEIVHRWSSQYYESADGLPYIGNLPGYGNILVATGFGGNGITYSHAAARCFEHLLTGSEHPYPFFDPNRIKPVAGFTNFVKQNADVAGQLIKKLFPTEKMESLSELAKDEAKVLRFENETVAIYKDPAGAIHAIDPSCSHMKCHVNWNDAEKSWDCPCHGARFSPDGKVLNSPADKDLQQVQIGKPQMTHSS